MSLPRRLIHNEYDLEELAEQQDRPIELIERDNLEWRDLSDLLV